jgi:hypothetical protein
VPLFFPGREAQHPSSEESTSPLERLAESEITFACEETVDSIGQVACELRHPQSIRTTGNAAYFDPSRRHVDKEQHHEACQTSTGPYLHREKIGRDNRIPMATRKFFPGRFPTSLGRRFNAASECSR